MASRMWVAFAVAVLAAGFVALACSRGDAPAATSTPATGEADVAPSGGVGVQGSDPVDAKLTPAEFPPGHDSNQAMYDVVPGFSPTSQGTLEALDDIARFGDRSLVPVLVEIIRFMPSAASRDRVGAALRAVTGQSFGSDDWHGWMEWLGLYRDVYTPPSEYVNWKIGLMSSLDPRFALFLRPALEYSRIDLTEVVWGGVLPDGIPDLRSPPMVSAADADYLNPNDRVFGVTINGDTRAYPLRIVNAHEMVNDVVGGEPISVMW